MKMIKEQSQKHPSGKNQKDIEKLNNNERNREDMNSKSIRIMQRKLGAIAAAACLALGLASVAQAQIVTFQEGVNGYAGTQDTWIGGNAPFRTTPQNGTELDLYEREVGTTNDARILVEFDISSITDPSVTNASLTLTLKAFAFGTHPTPTQLYLVNSGNAAWTEAQATWENLNQSTTTPWAGGPGLVAGIDYNAIPIATVNTPASDWANGDPLTFVFNAAGVAAMNDWIANPGNNYGFFISQGSGNPGTVDLQSFVQFHSSEADTATFHPLLTLEIPEPATVGLAFCGGLVLWLRRRRA